MSDLISRQVVLDAIRRISLGQTDAVKVSMMTEEYVKAIPPVNPQKPKTGHCKDCKHFEYDSVAKVDGIPLIIAHEICNRWGNGCKTREDGYCFLFEPQESEEV